MKCPFCEASNARVIDTRTVSDGIRRRRECQECHQRFTTYERIARVNLLVVKRDQSRQGFDHDKLLRSMQAACSKRPVSADALEDAARAEQSARDKAPTIRLLESALDLYLDCGAQRDTARVQNKLRRLGVHPVRRLSTERPKSGWESLTSAELRVVRAIVDGSEADLKPSADGMALDLGR